jgi:hypothetical protein
VWWLRGWILSAVTSVGSVFEHLPDRFIVGARQRGLQTVLAQTRSGIREKVSRYASVARANNMSIVVAVAAETGPQVVADLAPAREHDHAGLSPMLCDGRHDSPAAARVLPRDPIDE